MADEKAPSELEFELRIGGKDQSGRKIRFIHARAAGKYVVYETTQGQVVVAGNISLGDEPELNKLLNEIADLTNLSPMLGNRKESTHSRKQNGV